MTVLPVDVNGVPIPILRSTGAAQLIAMIVTTVRQAVAFDAATQFITIHSDQPFFYLQGDVTVDATVTDHHWPADLPLTLGIGGANQTHLTHLAVIRDGTDGTVWITEKQ